MATRSASGRISKKTFQPTSPTNVVKIPSTAATFHTLALTNCTRMPDRKIRSIAIRIAPANGVIDHTSARMPATPHAFDCESAITSANKSWLKAGNNWPVKFAIACNTESDERSTRLNRKNNSTSNGISERKP